MAIVRLDPYGFWTGSFMRPIMDEHEQNWPQVQMTEGLDVYEDTENDRVVVKAALPGVPVKNIKVTFENGVLHVSGREETADEEKKGKKVMYRRDRVTAFDYTCTLPRPIDANALSADMENGVLVVSAPIAPEAKPKTIPVQVKK